MYGRFRQSIKFFYLRESDINNRILPGRIQHFGQPVQGLWTKNKIYKGCALCNRGTFLAGDTSTNANFQFRIFLFELFPPAKLMKHLLLGLFPDGTGVQQQ